MTTQNASLAERVMQLEQQRTAEIEQVKAARRSFLCGSLLTLIASPVHRLKPIVRTSASKCARMTACSKIIKIL